MMMPVLRAWPPADTSHLDRSVILVHPFALSQALVGEPVHLGDLLAVIVAPMMFHGARLAEDCCSPSAGAPARDPFGSHTRRLRP